MRENKRVIVQHVGAFVAVAAYVSEVALDRAACDFTHAEFSHCFWCGHFSSLCAGKAPEQRLAAASELYC
jgi:hypothetical protein